MTGGTVTRIQNRGNQTDEEIQRQMKGEKRASRPVDQMLAANLGTTTSDAVIPYFSKAITPSGTPSDVYNLTDIYNQSRRELPKPSKEVTPWGTTPPTPFTPTGEYGNFVDQIRAANPNQPVEDRSTKVAPLPQANPLAAGTLPPPQPFIPTGEYNN